MGRQFSIWKFSRLCVGPLTNGTSVQFLPLRTASYIYSLKNGDGSAIGIETDICTVEVRKDLEQCARDSGVNYTTDVIYSFVNPEEEDGVTETMDLETMGPPISRAGKEEPTEGPDDEVPGTVKLKQQGIYNA